MVSSCSFRATLRRSKRPLCQALRHASSSSASTTDTSSASVQSTRQNSQKHRVIFSGIQPTGVPHIGNYLGALQSWVHMQRTAAPDDVLVFSVVGWHALTLPQDPHLLRQARREMLASLIAVGLNPERSIIFHQDMNPDHTELAWLLSCVTPFGKLRRMTTWKSRLAISRNANDESEVDETMLSTGLFTYPVLQAADILAYQATHVPVGDDQQQHLELCRDIAQLFNRNYDTSLFPLPECVFTPSKRILSLKDPSAKMSKSALDESSRIMITDDTRIIRIKIRSAVTDSLPNITYDPVSRPGTSNLLTILANCLEEDIHAVAKRYEGKGHAALKQDVFEAVEETVKAPRAEVQRLREDPTYLDFLGESGAAKAKEMSSETLRRVRQLVGLN